MARDQKRSENFFAREKWIEDRARRNQEIATEALHAVNSGTATLTQYELLTADLVRAARNLWVPTLTVGRARRRLDLPEGPRDKRGWMAFLVGDLLSHQPGEHVSPELTDKLKSVDELWAGKKSDPDLRLNAALARLAVGPGCGESVRASLWKSQAHKRARKECCDPQASRDRGLLGVWPEMNCLLESLALEDGAPPVPEDHFRMTTYEGIEQVLMENF